MELQDDIDFQNLISQTLLSFLHDIRGPVGSIKAYSEMLKTDLEKGNLEDATEMLEGIITCSDLIEEMYTEGV